MELFFKGVQVSYAEGLFSEIITLIRHTSRNQRYKRDSNEWASPTETKRIIKYHRKQNHKMKQTTVKKSKPQFQGHGSGHGEKQQV